MEVAIGEIAGIKTCGRPAHPVEATRLLLGYSGSPHLSWADGPFAVAGSGAAELFVSDALVVLVEGRLDDPSELIARVGQRAQDSLSGLIAAAWLRAGPQMVDWLVGDISAIVVDRVGGSLYALRDICAGRPLHVSTVAGSWATASDWQPLASEGRWRQPSREWFAAMLTGQTLDPRAMPYEGVEMVLPGSVASSATVGWNQTRHAVWHVPKLERRAPGGYRDDFLELFDTAVTCRITDQARIGVALSGGLDSTSVMATAAATAPGVGRTALCMPMHEPEGDERAIQTSIATRADADLRWIDLSQCGPLGPNGPEAVFESFGAPPITSNWSLPAAMAQEAGTAGLRVVLDGEDGDGILGGHLSFFSDLMIRGRWRTWLREAHHFRTTGAASGRELARLSVQFLVPPLLRRLYDAASGREVVPSLVSAELSADLDLKRRLRSVPVRRAWSPGNSFALGQKLVGHPDHLGRLMTHASHSWRRQGIHLSHPWADRRLMSFCMGLPYEHVYTAGWTKVVARQAMSNRLPETVVNRPNKSDISEVVRRAALGREEKFLNEGLRLARTQTDWFDSSAVTTLTSGLPSRQDYFPYALRVATLAWWLRWCGRA